MTLTQYRRVCVFAMRMVPVSIGGSRWEKVLKEHVREVLMRMGCENFSFYYKHIIDWENTEYDETAKYSFDRHLASYPCDFVKTYCWDNNLIREGRRDWDYTKTGRALSCCIRAAIDIAVSPSAGVAGYTVGDLRKMWAPKPMPKWVVEWFEGDITQAGDNEGVWL